MKQIDTWFNDVFFPVVYYRLTSVIQDVSYDEFKNNVLLRKIDCNWISNSAIIESTTYALCYRIDLKRDAWIMFSIGSSGLLTERDVVFHANTNRKSHAAFAYEFSSKTKDSDVCKLLDLNLPNDAIEQLRNSIINRNDNEDFRFRSKVILFPKETFEEVLVERDFASRV